MHESETILIYKISKLRTLEILQLNIKARINNGTNLYQFNIYQKIQYLVSKLKQLKVFIGKLSSVYSIIIRVNKIKAHLIRTMQYVIREGMRLYNKSSMEENNKNILINIWQIIILNISEIIPVMKVLVSNKVKQSKQL